jgi:tRNA G18 (ribose-2'-O)-methylase SpoU
MQEVALLLHNVRSTHNVGSIFRTADGAGVSRIYLSGYTPTPTDRFERARKDIAKTALGAENSVPWQKIINVKHQIDAMRNNGWQIVGVEQDARAIDYREFRISQPTLFIFGNEVRGISRSLRAQCDILIEIPMHGQKESLNVAVAAGVVLFSVIR